MFLSPQRKILFFHIPKTAGNSVKTSLGNKLPSHKDIAKHLSNAYLKIVSKNNSTLDLQTLKALPPQHIDQVQARPIFDLLNLDLSDYFEFVIVRNPYDRILSQYNYNNYHGNIDKFLDEYETSLKDTDSLWLKSQLAWINNPITDKIHIFKYEELDKCETELKKILKDENFSLFHVNQNKKAIKESFTSQQKQRCYQLFKEEFDILGYDK